MTPEMSIYLKELSRITDQPEDEVLKQAIIVYSNIMHLPVARAKEMIDFIAEHSK